MSNTRKPRQGGPRARRHGPRAPRRSATVEGLEPWLRAMMDADEAELLGDAGGALEAMARREIGPDGRPFWRPSRLVGLRQLVLLAPYVPRWARSRWILEQALQRLDEHDRGARARAMRASEVAVELRGGWATVRGRDEADKAAQVFDHDWVYRQLFLHELGGLDAFLRAATPDLVASADRVEEWSRAPMGGLVFLGADGPTLMWHDLGSGELVEIPDIGTGAHLAPGRSVIGRLVPIEGGRLFESTPLAVPRAVAQDVAHDPAGWLDVLRGVADQVRAGTIRTDVRDWCGLLSDVPLTQTEAVLAYCPEEHRMRLRIGGVERARATLTFARSVLADERRDRHEHDEEVDEECPDCFDDGWDGGAQLHAALLDPEVVLAMPGVLDDDDVDVLHEVSDLLAEPARSWVAWLVEQRVRAA